MKTVAEILNGHAFTQFLKHVQALWSEVLLNEKHTLSANSFLVFLQWIGSITHSEKLNDLLLTWLAEINIDLVTPEALLDSYQKYSVDFKFEESMRIEEIQRFAKDVVPEPWFLFN